MTSAIESTVEPTTITVEPIEPTTITVEPTTVSEEMTTFTEETTSVNKETTVILEDTTPAPEQAFPDNVGLDIIIKNSQNDDPVPGAVVSVSIDDEKLTNGTAVRGQGSAYIQVHRNGTYSLNIEAEGFIPSNFTMRVQCASADCPNRRLVPLSPLLEVGETRIIMTWEREKPEDIDLHVMAWQSRNQTTPPAELISIERSDV